MFDDYWLRVGGKAVVVDLYVDEQNITGGSRGTTASVGGDEMEKGKRIVSLYKRPLPEGPAPSRHLADLLDPAKMEAAGGLELVAAGVADLQVYQGEKSVVWICGWKSVGAARAFAQAVYRIEGDELDFVEVKRDYGKYDREEAPEDADAAQDASVRE